METHYEVLNIPEDAKEEQIKAAYRARALVHHPNKGGLNADFKRLGAAYDVLKNPELRRDYDLALKASRVHSKNSGGAGGGAGGSKTPKTSKKSKGGAGGGHNNSRGGAGGGAKAPKCSKDTTLTDDQRELIQNLKNAVDLHSDENFDALERPIAAIMALKLSGRDLTGCREFINAVKTYKRSDVFQQQKNNFIRTHGLRKAERRSRKARKSRKNRRTQRR